MAYQLDVILDFMAQFFWVMGRITGLFMAMTTIGGNSVPTRIRLALVVTVTFVIAPNVTNLPNVELFSMESLFILIQQILVGATIGFISELLMQTFVTGGQVLAMQTSLGFASMVDPVSGQNSAVIGQLYLLMATLIFFGIDGHLQLLSLIALSFDTIPISMYSFNSIDFYNVAKWYSNLFIAALAMSLSSIVAMLLVNFSFGIMNRSASQLNIFSLGFSVVMIFGLFVLWITMSDFMIHFERQWDKIFSLACTLLKIGC